MKIELIDLYDSGDYFYSNNDYFDNVENENYKRNYKYVGSHMYDMKNSTILVMKTKLKNLILSKELNVRILILSGSNN